MTQTETRSQVETPTTRVLTGIEIPGPGDWTLDPAHASAAFTARHLMVSKVRGAFDRFEATLHVGETPEDTWVEATIDAASIGTGESRRDDHLRSADFLDVERFPHLTFRSTKTERVGETRLKVTGDLTIRDVTRPVVLEVEYAGMARDHTGTPHAGFSATTEIDREDFGITWNMALEAGGVLVGKVVKIELEVELVPAQTRALAA